MSTQTKFWLCRGVALATIPLMLLEFSYMVPAGLSGNTHTVKQWFAAAMLTVIAGCTAYLTASYYRVRLQTHGGAEVIDVLSAAAKETARAKHTVRTTSLPTRPAHKLSKRSGPTPGDES